MTAFSGTPGPWRKNNWTQATDAIAIGAIGTPLIARVFSRDVSYNQQKANANLIIAGPELLKAAQAALLLLETIQQAERDRTGEHDQMPYPEIVELQDAIKLALEGDTNAETNKAQ